MIRTSAAARETGCKAPLLHYTRFGFRGPFFPFSVCSSVRVQSDPSIGLSPSTQNLLLPFLRSQMPSPSNIHRQSADSVHSAPSGEGGLVCPRCHPPMDFAAAAAVGPVRPSVRLNHKGKHVREIRRRRRAPPVTPSLRASVALPTATTKTREEGGGRRPTWGPEPSWEGARGRPFPSFLLGGASDAIPPWIFKERESKEGRKEGDPPTSTQLLTHHESGGKGTSWVHMADSCSQGMLYANSAVFSSDTRCPFYSRFRFILTVF